ncbi:MAG: hypothetical protein AAAB11_11335, partial [Rhizobium giardinii]
MIPIVFTSKNWPLFSQVAASEIGSAKDRRSMVQCGRPIGGANRMRWLCKRNDGPMDTLTRIR